ncbi:MAG: thiamine-phosphate kinase [Bacteroidia bacterium]
MFENKNNRTELSELGEFGLIEHISKSVKLSNKTTVKGIGDDAAVIDNTAGMTVLTSDMLIEGIHFDLTFSPLKHLGYKAVVVNLSDVYAMNARPNQVLVNIGVSNRFSLEAIEEFYAGVLLACEKYGVDLAGGDTTSSQHGFIISVTAIGVAANDKITYRNGAKVNDLICVTGDLGAAYVGLQLLEREKKIFLENPNIQPDFEGHDYILERQLKPETQKWLIEELEKAKVVPTAMIDISDGLSSEIIHICTQSEKGCQLYEDKIPVDHQTVLMADEFNLSPSVCALNGGEDYELLFTVSQKDFEKVKAIKNIHFLGYITEATEGINLINKADQAIPLRAQGWNALNKD